jgi:N-acyl homoserine lactone hydrolase
MGTGTAKRFWALEGATLAMDKAHLMLHHPSEKITVPCPSFLVEHKRGLVLWDTGLYPGAADDPVAVYGQDFVDFLNMRYDPHQRIDRQIESAGFSLSDVKFVIASHVHFDHAGGLYLFPHAKILVGAGEISYALWPVPHHADFFRREDILAVPRQSIYEVAQELDLFGDGSITILLSPGHTPGSLSLLVRLPSRTFILTGDAIHIREEIDTLLPLPDDHSAVEAVRSIERIRLLAAANDAAIWIGHDPRDWADFGGAACYE